LDLNYVRENLATVLQALENRGASEETIKALSMFASADQARREAIAESDQLNAERNTLSQQVGVLMKAGRAEEALAIRARVGTLKDRIAEHAKRRDEAETHMRRILESIPNVP